MNTKSDQSKREKPIKPTHIQIQGHIHEAKSWIGCLRIFLEAAYKHKPKKFDSTFKAHPERKKLCIYLDSEKEKMSPGKAKALKQIAGSKFHVSSKLGSQGNRRHRVQELCRRVQELLGWPKDSVQIFKRLYPDG